MSPISFSGRGSSYGTLPKSFDDMRSYSEPPECSVARPSPKSFTNQKSKSPLEESTVDHLRQAIRAQAEGIAHPIKISGPKTFWFRKRITTPALKRATALIIIHLNEVLDLELREESTYHRETGGNPHYQESDWQYAPLSDEENNARNDIQHINEDIPEGTSGTREPEGNEIGNISNNRLFDNDHNGENELASNVETYATSQAPNNGGQESQTDLDEIADASSGQTPLVSLPPSQETPKTPARKAGLFSKLVPSRLSNLFMPTPPPSSPVKPPQPATPSTPPPVVQPINFYNRRSSQTPEVSPSLVPASAVPPVVSYSRRSGKTPQLSPSPPSPPAVQPANVYNRRKTPELSPFTAPVLAVQPPNTPSRRSTKTPERSPPPIVNPAIEAADVYTHHSTKTPELPPTPRPAPAIRAANVQDRRSSKTLGLSPAPTPTPAPAIHLPSRKTAEPSPPSSSSSSTIPPTNPPPQPLLSSSSASDSDELLTPLPPSIITPQRTSQTRNANRTPPPSLPTRRSTRTAKPRTSARVAQMIPPNLRTAGSWGPYKVLPGARVEGGRGRSMGRSVGQKRSGSASSMSSASSVGSGRGGGGGGGFGGRVGGGGKRIRFAGVYV